MARDVKRFVAWSWRLFLLALTISVAMSAYGMDPSSSFLGTPTPSSFRFATIDSVIWSWYSQSSPCLSEFVADSSPTTSSGLPGPEVVPPLWATWRAKHWEKILDDNPERHMEVRAAGVPFRCFVSELRGNAPRPSGFGWEVYPLGLIQDAAVFLGIACVPLTMAGFVAATRRRRRNRGLCPTCGYDLCSIPPGSSCPECGSERNR